MDDCHARKARNKRKKKTNDVCVCVPTLCSSFLMYIRRKYVAQVIHRWPTGGCAVAAAVLVNATQMPFTCVLRSGGPVGVIEPVGSIIIIQSLSHGWIIQLTRFRPWRRRNQKVIPSREIFINSRVSRGLEKITSSPPLDDGGESPVSIENHHKSINTRKATGRKKKKEKGKKSSLLFEGCHHSFSKLQHSSNCFTLMVKCIYLTWLPPLPHTHTHKVVCRRILFPFSSVFTFRFSNIMTV